MERDTSQKVNPYSLPCVYKSCIESAAINLLQKQLKIEQNSHFLPRKEGVQEFGKWGQCLPERQYSATNFNQSPMNKNVSMLDSSMAKLKFSCESSTRSNPDEIPKTSIPPIPYQFRHHDGYQYYMEDYRNQYTICRLQQANHRRQVATRLRIRAMDLCHGPRRFRLILPNTSTNENGSSQTRYIKKAKFRLPNMKQKKASKCSEKKIDSLSLTSLPEKVPPAKLKNAELPSTSN